MGWIIEPDGTVLRLRRTGCLLIPQNFATEPEAQRSYSRGKFNSVFIGIVKEWILESMKK